jgi:predicted nucleic acid-binding Zn ribbon protein
VSPRIPARDADARALVRELCASGAPASAQAGGFASPMPDATPPDVRTPLDAGLCAVCGRSLSGRQRQRVCSPRCRIIRWRARRAQETAATLTRLLAENAALRQRVGELERLVGQLKRRLWPTA